MTAGQHRARSVLSTLTLIVCASATLVGCKSGGGASDATTSTSVTIPTLNPAPAPTSPASNSAPKISGSALGSARVSAPYSFAPSASDADGDALTFQVQNKPAWATFNTTTGTLSGTPTAMGTFANIVISTTDGKASAALGAFTITVNSAQQTTGVAALSWIAPTQNIDGSALTDLAGFVIAYGRSSTSLTESIKITNASVDRYVFDQLSAGTYFFAVRAYTAGGVESDLSSIVSKVIS